MLERGRMALRRRSQTPRNQPWWMACIEVSPDCDWSASEPMIWVNVTMMRGDGWGRAREVHNTALTVKQSHENVFFFGDITLVPFPMYILKDFSGIFRTLQWHHWHVACWPFQESSPSVHVTCRCWLYRLRAAQLLHKLPPNATSHKVAEIGASWFHKCDCIQIGKDKIRCDQRWNIVLVALASGDTSLKWMDLENTSLYGINSHSIHKVI